MDKRTPENILVALPTEINKFSAAEPQVYEDISQGASISYCSEDMTLLQVFLYDEGIVEIEDGISSDVVIQAREASAQDMIEQGSTGFFRDLTLAIDKILEFDFAGEKLLRTFYISFSGEAMDPESGLSWPIISDLYIAGILNYICKIRITRNADSDETELLETVGAILADLGSE